MADVPQSRPYFYCHARRLTVGDLVQPGNWGQTLHTYTPQSASNGWALARELTYEIVRARDFPQKPPRLTSNFLCMSEADLNEFRATTNRTADLGYAVELVDPVALSHVGDWTLLRTQSTDNLQVFVNRATLYWQGTDIVKQELVTLSPIAVTKVLSPV